MYVPHQFATSEAELLALAENNPFGIIVTNGPPLLATHIPFEVVQGEPNRLIGHLAKANEQWNTWTQDQEVLVIFNGPHAFVSASWYDHVNISTWNYSAAHFYGKLRIQNEKEKVAAVTRLLHRFEANSTEPVRMENLPERMKKSHLAGIVGFEITVERIEGVQKLSQNRDVHNHDQIVQKLRERNDPMDIAVAQAMQEQRHGKLD